MKKLENADEIFNSELPVFIDFYADWCRPCQMIGPILDKVSEEFKDKVSFVKVDVEKHQDLAVKFNVSAIPMLVLFVKGKEGNHPSITGVVNADKIKEFINKNIG